MPEARGFKMPIRDIKQKNMRFYLDNICHKIADFISVTKPNT